MGMVATSERDGRRVEGRDEYRSDSAGDHQLAKPAVLHLVDSFNSGGSESQAVQLVGMQVKSGRYRVHLACLNDVGPLRSRIESLSLGEIPEFALNSFYDGNMMRQLRRFAIHLRRLGITIVHTHDYYTNIFGMMGAWMARVPVRIASRRESSKRAALNRFIERGCYRLADAVVANCDEVRRQLIAEGVRAGKIVTVHNGLNLNRVESCEAGRRAALRRLCDADVRDGETLKFVTIVANIREVKNHTTFLHAAARIRAMVPESAFILAGEGPLLDDMRDLAATLGLGGRCFFPGRWDEVGDLLAISDVCVLSSKSEGFSNSVLEYMAARRPVVATNVGGIREAVREGESGYLVSPGDDEAMAARIASLLLDPERARSMGERARLIVEREFSCEAQLDKTEKLYERLLAASGRVDLITLRTVEQAN